MFTFERKRDMNNQMQYAINGIVSDDVRAEYEHVYMMTNPAPGIVLERTGKQ